MDPEKSSAAEPTPASPAPTQTAPVTPKESTPGRSTGPKGPTKLIIAIIAAVIIVGGLIFLFFSPWSPFVAAAPLGPKLKVGNNAYIYACPVLDKELVAKELDVKSDVNKENASESNAFDPANSKDKEEDVAKLTGEQEFVSSSCNLKLDRLQEGKGNEQQTSFINVTLSLQQYASGKKAEEAFQSGKTTAGDSKALPSFADKSYYTKPQTLYPNAPVLVRPQILHKNMLITVSAPSGSEDQSGEKTAGKLDAIVKDIVARIDRGEGREMKNFSGINQLGGNKFVDSCRSINYAKVTHAMGQGTELNAALVGGTQGYAPDNNQGATPNQLTSACTFAFRTGADKKAFDAAKQEPAGETLQYRDSFPHFLTVQISTTESKEKAQEFLKTARTQAQANSSNKDVADKSTVEDVKLGDGAIKLAMTKEFSATGAEGTGEGSPVGSSVGQLYYIAKGPYVFVFSTTYIKQDKPFKTDSQSLELSQISKIYKELNLATRRAQ